MPSDPKKQETKEKSNEIDLMKIGEKDSKFPSPIDLNIRITKEIQLPSLKWNNAEETPRLMKISNSGHSIIVTAKWFGPYRPYITGCQLPGTYIFSQAHFHWGKNDQEGSEHTTDGNKQPLELHVMYFKTDYGTPEKAMKELDGIIILAYFYNVRKQPNTGLVPIIDALPKVVQPYTSSPIELIPIAKFAPVFSDDFYSYWGNVYAQTNYKILWFISREAQNISSQQLSLFRAVMGANKEPLISNFRETKSINGRTIFLVNPGKMRETTLIEAAPDPEEKQNTPPPEENKKSSKGKGKAKPSAASAGRRKSAKRKSSVRRKSRKESDKHTKSGKSVDREVQWSSQDTGPSLYMSDESRIHHEPRILMTGVAFSQGGKRHISSSSSSSSSCSSSSSTASSTSSCCSGLKQECSFDIDEFEKRCEILLEQNEVLENIPFVDIIGIMGKGNTSAKCEQLLNKLHSCRAKQKEKCLPILNESEIKIKATIEKDENNIEKVTKGAELRGQEDLSAIGEGTAFFNTGVQLVPFQEISKPIKPPQDNEFAMLKDLTKSNELVSFNNTITEPFQNVQSTESSPTSTTMQPQYEIMSTPFESRSIQKYKPPEEQMAKIASKPPTETGKIVRIVNNNLDENRNVVQQAPQAPVQQGFNELRRNRIQNDSTVTQASSLQVEVSNINQNLWNLPQLLSSNAMLTELTQQVSNHGVKFISNETMAVVTSQLSSDDNFSKEQPVTKNVSYLSSQNTIMEFNKSPKSSKSRRYGQRVNKLRRNRSSVKHFNAMSGLDKGQKRQTMITKIFQKTISNPKFVRTANANAFMSAVAANDHHEAAQGIQEMARNYEETEKNSPETPKNCLEMSRNHQKSAEIRQESANIHQEPAKIHQELSKIHQEMPKIHQETPKIRQDMPKIRQEAAKNCQNPPVPALRAKRPVIKPAWKY